MIGDIKRYLQLHRLVRWMMNTVIVMILILGVLFIVTYSMLFGGRKRLNNDSYRIISESNSDIDYAITYKRNMYAYNRGMINILILGIDGENDLYSRNLDNGLGQSDALFLMSIDTVNDAIRLISIPRDTMTLVKAYDETGNIKNIQTMQIALQYAYGRNVEEGGRYAAESVSSLLYNVSIDRVIVLEMDAIASINDAFGGVDVTIENDFTDESGEILEESFIKGNVVHLEGDMARIFIQERDCDIAGSAMDRLSRQEQYFEAIIPKAETMLKKNPLIAISLYAQLKDKKYLYTDMTMSEIVYILYSFLQCDFSSDNIYKIPGRNRQGDRYEEYRVKSEDLKDLIMNLFYVRLQ